MSKFVIKQGDTSPAIRAQLHDSSGAHKSLIGATVTFEFGSTRSKAQTFSRSASIIDADKGIVQYNWQSGDTDTSGIFYAEFKVQNADNTVETFPNSEYITVEIIEQLRSL